MSIDPSPSPNNEAVSIILTFGVGDDGGNEPLLASTGIGRGHDQQQMAEKTIGKFISHVDGAMSKNNAPRLRDDD